MLSLSSSPTGLCRKDPGCLDCPRGLACPGCLPRSVCDDVVLPEIISLDDFFSRVMNAWAWWRGWLDDLGYASQPHAEGFSCLSSSGGPGPFLCPYNRSVESRTVNPWSQPACFFLAFISLSVSSSTGGKRMWNRSLSISVLKRKLVEREGSY